MSSWPKPANADVLEQGVVRVNPTARYDLERLVGAASGQGELAGVLYLWGLDAGSRESEPTLGTIAAAQRRGCGGLLSLVQALVRDRGGDASGTCGS